MLRLACSLFNARGRAFTGGSVAQCGVRSPDGHRTRRPGPATLERVTDASGPLEDAREAACAGGRGRPIFDVVSSWRTVVPKHPPARAERPAGNPVGSSYLPYAAIGGGLALLGYALVESMRAKSPPTPAGRLVVGGVDLSTIDLRQPFVVDFSTGPGMPARARHASLERLRYAMIELRRWQPHWLFRPNVDAGAGTFMLYVVPVQPAETRSPTLPPSSPHARESLP